jgi:hypothetical protein
MTNVNRLEGRVHFRLHHSFMNSQSAESILEEDLKIRRKTKEE